MTDEIVKSIADKNHIDILSIDKFSSGQVNSVFNINNQYVVKIEGDPSYAKDLLKGQYEKVQALVQKGAKVPKIIDSGEVEGKNYLLMEKIEGENLVSHWYSFNDTQKENYIAQIAEQLKIFHSITSGKYFGAFDNFKDAIVKETGFSEIDKIRLKPEYASSVEILEKFFADNIALLNETDTGVLNHNDLHFENIFYKDDKISGIIDFDYATFASKDYEFKKLVDFAHTPTDYVQDSLQSRYEGRQLIGEFKMLKKHYPELFEHPNVVQRVKLYSISGLLWTIAGYQQGRWSENAMIKTQRKIKDWYQSSWIEKLLS
jgi:aminoglycoside phosphotransferase